MPRKESSSEKIEVASSGRYDEGHFRDFGMMI
jgi:hypothetical protein